MTTIETPAADNGVNVAALLGAREAMTAHPEAAQFRFGATNEWLKGTHSRSTVKDFRVNYEIDADASRQEIEAVVAQSQKRSAVFDIVTNPTTVSVSVV